MFNFFIQTLSTIFVYIYIFFVSEFKCFFLVLKCQNKGILFVAIRISIISLCSSLDITKILKINVCDE